MSSKPTHSCEFVLSTAPNPDILVYTCSTCGKRRIEVDADKGIYASYTP